MENKQEKEAALNSAVAVQEGMTCQEKKQLNDLRISSRRPL